MTESRNKIAGLYDLEETIGKYNVGWTIILNSVWFLNSIQMLAVHVVAVEFQKPRFFFFVWKEKITKGNLAGPDYRVANTLMIWRGLRQFDKKKKKLGEFFSRRTSVWADPSGVVAWRKHPAKTKKIEKITGII